MRITDYPDLLRTKGKEPMPQAWDETNQDWTPAIDSAATLKALREALGAPADATQADPVQEATAIALLKGLLELTAMRATDQTLTQIKTALTDGTQKVALTGNLAPLETRTYQRYGALPGAGAAEVLFDIPGKPCELQSLSLGTDYHSTQIRISLYKADDTLDGRLRIARNDGSSLVDPTPGVIYAHSNGENDFWKNVVYELQTNKYVVVMKRNLRANHGMKVEVANADTVAHNVAVNVSVAVWG